MAETKANPKPKRTNGPRPAYLLTNKPLPDDLEIVGITRKAEDALAAIDSGTAGSYMRVMIK